MNHRRVPLYALIAAVIFIIAAVVLAVIAPPDSESTVIVIGLIASTIPSLVAAFASEKTNRDIANGVLTEKARVGTRQALDETGLTEIAATSGATQSAALEALTQILQERKDNG